jgi:hypothetical protein
MKEGKGSEGSWTLYYQVSFCASKIAVFLVYLKMGGFSLIHFGDDSTLFGT